MGRRFQIIDSGDRDTRGDSCLSLQSRQLLIFFGASAGTAVLAPALGDKIFGSNSSAAAATLAFTPVRLPHPLPIYQQLPSFLTTGNGEGQLLNPSQDARLTSYTVLDDLIVPPEYERYVYGAYLSLGILVCVFELGNSSLRI